MTRSKAAAPKLPDSGTIRYSSPPASASDDYNPWPILAVMRFVLALIVVCAHYSDFVDPSPLLMHLGGLSSMIAVQAFLVISGYSIANSLETQPSGFYSRRLDRLYPVYFTAFILGMIPFLVGGNALDFRHSNILSPDATPFGIWTLIGNALFLQGWLCPVVMTIGPFWSLGVEAAFYLVAPVMRKTPTGVLCFLLAISIYVFTTNFQSDWPNQMFGLNTLVCGWAWIAGFLFYRYRKDTSPWRMVLMILIGASQTIRGEGANGVLLWSLFCAILLAAESLNPIPKYIQASFSWLGDLSYPLYAVHFPVMCIIGLTIKPTNPFAYIGASLVAAVIVLHCIDYPFRSYRKKQRSIQPKIVQDKVVSGISSAPSPESIRNR